MVMLGHSYILSSWSPLSAHIALSGIAGFCFHRLKVIKSADMSITSVLPALGPLTPQLI